jgi:hypothetical protein
MDRCVPTTTTYGMVYDFGQSSIYSKTLLIALTLMQPAAAAAGVIVIIVIMILPTWQVLKMGVEFG